MIGASDAVVLRKVDADEEACTQADLLRDGDTVTTLLGQTLSVNKGAAGVK